MPNHIKQLKAITAIVNPSMLKAKIFKGVPMPRKRTIRKASNKPRRHDEQDLSRHIDKDLDFLEIQGRIIHHDRLNCGKAQRGPYWITLCKDGTSDRFVMLPGRLILFLEIKAGTKQSATQKIFQEKAEKAGHKYYLVEDWNKWLYVRDLHIVSDFIFK